MLDLITAKRNEIQKLRQEIAILECDIEKLELTEKYDVRFNIWYKTEDSAIFFRPIGTDNGYAVGLSINLRENELAYELDDDTFGLENSFSKMQVSSYGEMLNAVNLHNLKILEQYKGVEVIEKSYTDTNGNERCSVCHSKIEGGYCDCVAYEIKEKE